MKSANCVVFSLPVRSDRRTAPRCGVRTFDTDRGGRCVGRLRRDASGVKARTRCATVRETFRSGVRNLDRSGGALFAWNRQTGGPSPSATSSGRPAGLRSTARGRRPRLPAAMHPPPLLRMPQDQPLERGVVGAACCSRIASLVVRMLDRRQRVLEPQHVPAVGLAPARRPARPAHRSRARGRPGCGTCRRDGRRTRPRRRPCGSRAGRTGTRPDRRRSAGRGWRRGRRASAGRRSPRGRNRRVTRSSSQRGLNGRRTK